MYLYSMYTNYPKPLFLTDAAVNITPSLTDKMDIVQNAIDLFTVLGLGTPKWQFFQLWKP